MIWSGELSPGVRIWPRATPNTPEKPVHVSGGGDVGDTIEENRYHPSHRLTATFLKNTKPWKELGVWIPPFQVAIRNDWEGPHQPREEKKVNHAEGGFSRLNQVLQRDLTR